MGWRRSGRRCPGRPCGAVAEELLPLGVGGGPVLLGRAEGSPSGDERPVAVDRFFGIDGLVAHGGVDVAVPGDELGDVRWHPVQDGVGDEDSPEVVRGEPQQVTGGVDLVKHDFADTLVVWRCQAKGVEWFPAPGTSETPQLR